MTTKVTNLVLAAAALLGVLGCTHATPLTVAIEAPAGRPKPALELRSVEYVASESKLANIGTYAWGRYDEEDLEALRVSFQNSVAPFAAKSGSRLHILVRRVLVATTSSAALTLSCVAWAMEGSDGSLLFHEQFYAWDSVHLLGSTKGVKNGMHEAIVQRVLQTAVRLATSGGAPPPTPDPPRTSTDFQGVARVLPSFLLTGYGVPGATQVSWVRKLDDVDWTDYLRGK